MDADIIVNVGLVWWRWKAGVSNQLISAGGTASQRGEPEVSHHTGIIDKEVLSREIGRLSKSDRSNVHDGIWNGSVIGNIRDGAEG
jgi:hypothetical protein